MGADERTLPAYDELPITRGAPPGSSWGLWAEGDVLGCLNLLTPERLRRALGGVRRGDTFALDFNLELPDPPLFGRSAFVHHVGGSPIHHDDELSGWNTQSSSQWDGFRHIRHPEHGFYGGVADESHGVHHWARRGIAGGAVLADVGRWRSSVDRPISMGGPDPIPAADVLACLEAQGTAVEMGDILLVRTGWMTWYRELAAEGRAALATSTTAPGLHPGEETVAMLWNLHIAAVAADNPALEIWPPGALLPERERGSVMGDPTALVEHFAHLRILPLLGLPIGELWDLDRLAEDCARDGVYRCALTSAPLNLASGVASPPNALAIK